MTYSMGRLYVPDERDHAYPMQALLPAEEVLPVWRNWQPGAILDQGNKSYCVGAGWEGWLRASPVRTTTLDMKTIYCESLAADEWPENDNDCEAGQFGTSVRAGAKVLLARGHIDSYHWAATVDDVVNFILSAAGGPVVTGFDWKSGMLAVDSKGFIHVTGDDVGGHCTYFFHANRKLGYLTGINSWGPGWGRRGRFRLSFDDLALLLSANGEACVARERGI